MLSVGIIGSSGYTGKYLIKILSNHPKVANIELFANSSAGNELFDIHPEFKGRIENTTLKSLDQLKNDYDVIFAALPHGISHKVVPDILDNTKLLIDLSGDFRLKEPKLYSKYYGYEHKQPELLNESLYALADIKNNYNKYKLISNPGCYPTAVSLGLIPIINELSSTITSISVSAYSGVSGAGKKLKEEFLFSELENNLYAYKVNEHQHEPEILQTLASFGFDSDFSFTAHLMPQFSGIYATAVVFAEEGLELAHLLDIYESFYSNSFFVRTLNHPPKLKLVKGTNFCHLNISVKENKAVITTAIDNLIKGAAGQAVQNMNNYFEFDTKTGLINI